MRIWPTDSACQPVLQIQSSLGSPSKPVFLISELKTNHHEGKQFTSKRDKKLPMMFWHAQELWKHRPVTSRPIEARRTVKLGNVWFNVFAQTGCLKSLIFCQSLRPTTGERRPFTIGEIKICKREAEQSLEGFAPVQMLLLLTVVWTPQYYILYRGLNNSVGLINRLSYSLKVRF